MRPLITVASAAAATAGPALTVDAAAGRVKQGWLASLVEDVARLLERDAQMAVPVVRGMIVVQHLAERVEFERPDGYSGPAGRCAASLTKPH